MNLFYIILKEFVIQKITKTNIKFKKIMKKMFN